MRHGYCEWKWCAPTEYTNFKSVLICTKKKYEVNSCLNMHVRNFRFFDTFKDFHHNAVFLSFGYETGHSLKAHIPATWISSRRLSSWSPSFTLSLIPFYCLSYSAKGKEYSTKLTTIKQLKNICISARIWEQLYYRTHWVCPAENRQFIWK